MVVDSGSETGPTTSQQTTIEERAEVNQRALIDKVLARYSGEFTLFRELLQNADDSGSSNAEIHFKTAVDIDPQYPQQAEHSPPPATCPLEIANAQGRFSKVAQWTFKNDGKVFDRDDWKRLPRIAEGNPNPEKIGAFGVGFYSVFSVTDSPCVSSGESKLQFYWKKDDNQLYTRRSTLPQPDPWTTFQLPLREPRLMLPLLDLMRFLASSITFMVNVVGIGVYFDDDRIGHIKKSLELTRTIDIPEEMKRSSYNNIMHVKEVESHHVTLNAEIKHGIRACPAAKGPPSTEVSKSRVDLTIFTAEVGVSVDQKLSEELYRSMKKQPPPRLKYSLIYTGKDEYDRNSAEQRNDRPEAESIFQGLHADLEGAKHTRIFIGHATGQTTSVGGHMASRFIPTVERESIDFVDKYVSVWNKELLHIGGFLCRVVYELELTNIQRLWEAAVVGTIGSEQSFESHDDLHRRFLHILKFFTFHDSAPSSKVAYVLHKSFYYCSSSPLRLLSSVGVRKAPDIRAFDSQVAKFLDSIPMLSELVTREAARNIDNLPESCKISPVMGKDVLEALDGHPLSERKLAFCLQWWLELKRSGSSLSAGELLKAVTFEAAGGTSRSLSQVANFININGLGVHIPRDGPLPASLVPYSVSTYFVPTDLAKFGWKELTILDWFRYISRSEIMLKDPTHDFTKSPDWAGRVLYVLSRAWSSLSDKERPTIKTVLEQAQCVPTSCGLRCPEESYLPIGNDALLRKFGLPVVATPGFELDREMSALLSSIGVQAYIPLELLSDKMLDTGEWSIFDLIHYLVRLTLPLSVQHISMLKVSTLFSDDVGERPRCCASELYPPLDLFRQLKLPVIKWDKKSKWLDESDEAKLLYRLGLQRYPPLKKIIELCASPNSSIRESAFPYFCENLRSKYSEYNFRDYHEVAFVPAESKEEGTCLKSPRDVFLGVQWKALGFSVVRNAYQKFIVSELGVRQDPPPSEILHVLETRPPCYEEAREWYECLSECIQTFTQPELAKLSDLKIVPKNSPDSRQWLKPAECYLGPPTNEFYSKLFVFVDFGTKANHFLSACGSMKEPSAKDVAERLIQDPPRFRELAGTHENFFDKIRDLATRKAYIPNDTLNKMSLYPTLLGKRRAKTDDQDEWKSTYDLRIPKEIVIVDDPRDYELFGDVVYVAPQDELLERFYSSLGCRRLSTVIQERYEESPAISDDQRCSKVQSLILQRLPSFLHKCSHYQYDQARVPKAGNFRVIACKRLLVHKTLIIGSDTQSREQDLWAVTKCEGKTIELWLSSHVDSDMYDLAASLCRILFGTVRFTDTVLLGAMLSDLKLLKRAGFDVEQFAEERPPDSPVATSSKCDATTTDDCRSSATSPAGKGSSSQSALDYIHGSITKTLNTANACRAEVKRRFTSGQGSSVTPELRNISRHLLSQNRIRDIVNEASEACSSERTRLFNEKDDILQFLRHYSCNDYAQVDNLQPVGITLEGIKVHVVGGVPDICAFIAGKMEMLPRFIRIITAAASAHDLRTDSLHVFYEAGGGPIAFNLEGSIYLNLRYFEEWHDKDVENGNFRQAQLSWFFVLAHEMAHSLIPSHDSAHAFWFSAICENHIGNLFRSGSMRQCSIVERK